MRLDLNQQCAEAEDLQSPGVTNFPTHPKFTICFADALYAMLQRNSCSVTVY